MTTMNIHWVLSTNNLHHIDSSQQLYETGMIISLIGEETQSQRQSSNLLKAK